MKLMIIQNFLGDEISLINSCRLKSLLSVELLLWEWIIQKHWVYHFLNLSFSASFLAFIFSLQIQIFVSLHNCCFCLLESDFANMEETFCIFCFVLPRVLCILSLMLGTERNIEFLNLILCYCAGNTIGQIASHKAGIFKV